MLHPRVLSHPRFFAGVEQNKKAEAFFKTLNKTNAYSVVYRLETAKKSETRTKRMKMILAMMEQGQTFHP